MSALDVIRRVETLGGRVILDGDSIRLQASSPLPDDVVAEVGREKIAIMIALGAPLNTAVTSVLDEVRPHLPRSLRQLPDERLIVLVNWSIIAAFESAVRNVHR